MSISEVMIPLEHLQERKGRLTNRREPCRNVPGFAAIDMWAPSVRSKVCWLQLYAREVVVATESLARIAERVLQSLLIDPIVRVHEAVCAMCGTEQVDGLPIKLRTRVVDHTGIEELLTWKRLAGLKSLEPGGDGFGEGTKVGAEVHDDGKTH